MTEIINSKGTVYDLEERTYEFSRRIINYCRKLPHDIANVEIRRQLIRSGIRLALIILKQMNH